MEKGSPLQSAPGQLPDRISKSAKADLGETDFPYELGYIFILPDDRGTELSHGLMAEALRNAEGTGVFATVRADNQAMLVPLAKAGCAVVGQEYAGRDKGRSASRSAARASKPAFI